MHVQSNYKRSFLTVSVLIFWTANIALTWKPKTSNNFMRHVSPTMENAWHIFTFFQKMMPMYWTLQHLIQSCPLFVSHIVSSVISSPTCRARRRIRHPRRVIFFLLWRAGATKQRSPQNQERSCCPADVERRSHLPSPGVRQQRVIKVPDDAVGRPGYGNQLHKPSYDEQHTC